MLSKYINTVLLLGTLIDFPCHICYSQNSEHIKKQDSGYAGTKWLLNDPFEQKVFIENNEGQFNGRTSSNKDKILFSTRINEVYLYFSSTGVTYRYDKYPDMKNNEQEKENSEGKAIQPKSYFFSINWKGANQNADVLAEDEVGFYYTYPKGNKHTVIAHAFKKLLYRNLYPGIDVEYSFPDGKKGLEYAIIVHPGADLSPVKMIYHDAKKIQISSEGNIESESSFGQFVDHTSAKTYYQDDNGVVSCSFSLKDNEVSYSANYDHTKTLVIDPWVVNPGFSNYNAGYDVCYDLKGNVYAYGSFSPYQEIKINSNGVIKWIYSIPNSDPQYGDFAVDETTGISYDGSCTYPYVYKVDTSGLQTGSYHINNTMEELWRMAFNKCENELIIGGGGTGLLNQACTLDTGLTTLNPVNVLNTSEAHHDMCFLAIDNDNSSIFLATVESNADGPNLDNVLLRCLLPNLTSTTYLVSDGFSFTEACCNANYIDGVGGHSLAMNGAVASPNWLYLYDGATLRRYNKITGKTVLSKTISTTQYTWGGIDVDLCNNLYLAKADTIMVYDSNLNNIGKILAPNTIYDLHIAPNNMLVAAGLHFVSTFSITTNPVSISFNYTPCANKGKATAFLNGCGNDSSTYNYLWSNGATTQTVTGLSSGTYAVSISSGCDFVYTNTVTISSPLNGNITSSIPSSICFGTADTLKATGGTTYNWSTGATTSAITVTPATTTTYTVGISNGACTKDTSIKITVDSYPSISLGGKDTVCSGTSTKLTASGGASYLWNTGATTSSISPTPLSNAVYTVQVNNGACLKDTTISVTVNHLPTVSLSGKDTVCAGTSTKLIASGGTSYLWNTGATTSSISPTPLSNAVYTVQVNNGTCPKDTSVKVTVNPLPHATITGSTPICTGKSDTLIASGGNTYLWSNSATSSSITISPNSNTTYSVTVNNGTCSKDTSIKITVDTYPSISLSGKDTVCAGTLTKLTVSGGTGYLWNTGVTTSSISPSPLSNTVYTVQVNNGACFKDTTISVTVNHLPIVSLSGNNTICAGDSATLNASGGITYSWNTGATTSSISVHPANTSTYTIVVNDGICPKDTSIKVTVNPLPHATITGDNAVCLGSNTILTASGGTTYLWSNSATSSSITITPNVDTTYSVTVNNGTCSKDTSIKITVHFYPTVSLSGKDTVCSGASTTLTAAGGTSYLWNTGATTSSISPAPLSSTVYTVGVGNGVCTKDTSIKITVDSYPSISLSGKDTVCAGTSTKLTASGGTSYQWSNGQTSDTITISPSSTSTYTVTVSSSFGCKDDTIFQVNVAFAGGSISGPPLVCVGDSITLTATGGQTYTWSTGSTDDSIVVRPAKNTSYHVIVFNGCTDTIYKTISIDNPNLYACCDTTIYGSGERVLLQASGALSYYWMPPNSITCDSCPDPIFTPAVTTTYTVIGTDSAGCRVERTITVDVASCLSDSIPNVFTPNGDGVNDLFIVNVQFVSDYSIVVYNRWGKEMYKSTNPHVYWTGQNQNDNSYVVDGIYYYTIKYTCDNKSYNKNGYVQVIR